MYETIFHADARRLVLALQKVVTEKTSWHGTDAFGFF